MKNTNEADFGKWVNHFRENARKVSAWKEKFSDSIPHSEKLLLGDSVAQFELGESSSGESFLAKARQFFKMRRDGSYMAALHLFIAEENGHSAMLSGWMEKNEVKKRNHHWLDAAFRFLRKSWNFEFCITALVTAEIVGSVYYDALRRASSCEGLKTICDRVLEDEIHHLRFQAQALALTQENKSAFSRSIASALRWVFLQGTILVFWESHRKVMLAGGYTFESYAKACGVWAVFTEREISRRLAEATTANPLLVPGTVSHVS